MPSIVTDEGDEIVVARAFYLETALRDLDQVVCHMRELMDAIPTFDTLVGRGLSGALIVPFVARALDKHWLIVRKGNDGSHSGELAEGTLGHQWLFMDDLIGSGSTLLATIKGVRQLCYSVGYTTELVGAYTYAPPIVRTYTELDLPAELRNDYVAPMPIPYLPEVYAGLKKGYTPKPKTPRPVKRGGKARRKLMELGERLEDQRRAMNDKMDLAVTNRLLQLLQENIR